MTSVEVSLVKVCAVPNVTDSGVELRVAYDQTKTGDYFLPTQDMKKGETPEIVAKRLSSLYGKSNSPKVLGSFAPYAGDLRIVCFDTGLVYETDFDIDLTFPLRKFPSGLERSDKDAVKTALSRLELEIQTASVATSFLPNYFTLPGLKSVFEQVWDIDLDTRNFRHKVLSEEKTPGRYLESVGVIERRGFRGRPPHLYKPAAEWKSNIKMFTRNSVQER